MKFHVRMYLMPLNGIRVSPTLPSPPSHLTHSTPSPAMPQHPSASPPLAHHHFMRYKHSSCAKCGPSITPCSSDQEDPIVEPSEPVAQRRPQEQDRSSRAYPTLAWRYAHWASSLKGTRCRGRHKKMDLKRIAHSARIPKQTKGRQRDEQMYNGITHTYEPTILEKCCFFCRSRACSFWTRLRDRRRASGSKTETITNVIHEIVRNTIYACVSLLHKAKSC